MELVTSHPLSLGILRWNRGEEQRLTVIVKLTFDLSRQGASLVDPAPLHDDLHHDGNEGRSLAIANDFVPRRAGADVVFRGHAWAKPGERVTEQVVRLTVSEGAEILVDKSLKVTDEEPFRELPIRYELATGAEPAIKHEGDGPVVHPAGFGPIAVSDPSRAALAIVAFDRYAPVLPLHFDFAYFNAAPRDQRTRGLSGREEIRLVGLHPGNPDVRSKLPGVRPVVTIENEGRTTEVPLVGDTLEIEGDTASCSLTFRGDVPFVSDEIRVLAQIVDGAALEARKMAPRSRLLSGTERDVGPALVLGARPVLSPQPAPAPAPPPRDRSYTMTMDLPVIGAAPFAFPVGASAGNVPIVAAPIVAAPSDSPQSLRVPIGGSEDAPASSMMITARSPRSLARAMAVVDGKKLEPPARVAEELPIINAGSFVPFSFHWSLRPPRDARIVVIKATFDLVAGGPATPAAEQDLPSGDVHWDDQTSASLRYPSDFAPFKPRADVLLVGDAHRASGRGVTLLRFVFGSIERRIAVFGDRTKAKGPQAAEPFETMPLRWERARGGPASTENPVGIGSSDGLLLPNLEDADALIGRGSDKPACTAPIAAEWPQRSAHLGTYDSQWLATRWPWFPEDFEWSYFNSAPPAQQIEYPEGDERFVLAGVLPGGEVLEGQMPVVTPRVFALRLDGVLFEVALRMDTIWFDASKRKLVVVHRGLIEVEDPDAMELSTLYVVDHDGSDDRLDVESARKRLHAELVARGVLPSPDLQTAVTAADNDLAGLSLGELYQRMQRDLDRAKEERGAAPEAELPEPEALPEIPPMTTEEAFAVIARGESLAGCDLSGVNFQGADLRGLDFEGTILTKANLRGARFEGARLVSANLSSIDGEDASFASADLSSANFTDATLGRASFTAAKLDDTLFERAAASGASFDGAKGARTIFTGAMLVIASFEKAELPSADFTEAKLEGARLVDANLENLRLYDCEGMDVTFDRSNLSGARANGARLRRCSALEIEAADSVWEGAELDGATFQGAVLTRAIFVAANLDDAILSRAHLVEARFRKARLRRTKFLKANLMKASFERADLEGADLRGANLYQVATWRAKTSAVRLEQAFVRGTRI